MVKWQAAQRSSWNRVAGTIAPHNLSITREVYENFMLTKVLPAIRDKCPAAMKSQTIRIQQHNAPPHKRFTNTYAPFIQARTELGLDLTLVNQPPNSPNLNVLDLSFFQAIQSLQQKQVTNTPAELIECVKNAYKSYNHKSIDNGFLTLQCCMNKVIECHGGNEYQIPHMGKERLERTGQLLQSIRITETAGLFK